MEGKDILGKEELINLADSSGLSTQSIRGAGPLILALLHLPSKTGLGLMI